MNNNNKKKQQQQSKTQTLCPEIIPQSPGKAETVQVRAMVLCRTLQDCFISNAIKNNQLIVANLVPGAISQNLLHQTVCPVFSLPRDTLQNFGREDPPFASLQTKAGCKRGKLYGFKCVFFLFLLSSFFFFFCPSFLPPFLLPTSFLFFSAPFPSSLSPISLFLFFSFTLLLSYELRNSLTGNHLDLQNRIPLVSPSEFPCWFEGHPKDTRLELFLLCSRSCSLTWFLTILTSSG